MLVSFGNARRSSGVWDCESGVGATAGVEEIDVLRLLRKLTDGFNSSSTMSLLSRASSASTKEVFELPVGGVYGRGVCLIG